MQSNEGYEGIVTSEAGVTVYRTGFVGCAEDADGMMASAIIRNRWTVLS